MSASRHSKWVDLRLQIGFILALLGAAIAGIVLHSVLTARLLGTLAVRLEREGSEVLETAPELVYRSALIALELLVPVLFLVGLLVSFRVLGPVWRFRDDLEQLATSRQEDLRELREQIEEGTAAALEVEQDEPAAALPRRPRGRPLP